MKLTDELLASLKDGEQSCNNYIIPNERKDIVQFNEDEEDFRTVRKNLLELIEDAQDVLKDSISLARSSDQPRAYEVVGSLIKQIADINKDLLEIKKSKKEICSKKEEEPKDKIINNNLFVGSTKDAQEFLRKVKIDE
jgi:hypothetical protein